MSHRRCCNDGFGSGFGGSGIWIIILILLFSGGFNGGCCRRRRC